MSEEIKLPEPLKIDKNILKQLDDLEKNGETIYAFAGEQTIETIFQLYLIKKYKSKCVVERKDLKFVDRPIGITINLKLKYSQAEENIMKEEFTHFSKKITECVEKGEKIIIIPLSYNRGKGGHANILIYRRDSNVIEHFEPHGGEYINNTKLQDSIKKIMLFFTKILNLEFKKKGIPQANYIEASQVCPYIKGLQTLEGASILKKQKIEGGGYCAAWSMFFAEVCLKNPNMSSPEVLENIYNYLTTKASSNDYLRKVIRGYAGYLVETVNKYLEIFFKPKITVVDIVNFTNNYKIVKLHTLGEAITVLVNIESEALLDENFDLKKELKKTMKEYRNITKGMTKEQQSAKRPFNKEMRFLYFRKRILQNYEEYNKHGKITEPLIDSPFEIKRETMINPDIIKKGRNAKEEDPDYMKGEKLRKMREEEKKARAEEKKASKKRVEAYLKKIEEDKKMEEIRKEEEDKLQIEKKKTSPNAKTEKKKKSPNSKTKKVKTNVIPENVKKALGKDMVKVIENIIIEKNLDMNTKEGKEELIKIIQEMGKK
jgi:hypothetical protein